MVNVEQFFRDYVAAFNRALDGTGDVAVIRNSFAPCFVAAGPTGVMCGQNDESFAQALEKGYAFYRSIGTRKMIFRGVAVIEVDDLHRMARVSYSSEYDRRDGQLVTIDFEVTYMLHLNDKALQIVADVAGDEQAVLRQHCLID